MAKIEPFCGVRYNSKKIGSLSKVVCPPYDVINKQQRLRYLRKSKYNAVNLVLPSGNTSKNAHKNAKRLIDLWLKQDILSYDKQPCIYACREEYKIDNVAKKRLGFIALLEIEADKDKTALPHEKIFKKFKVERFNLMLTTQAHLSPIFTVFKDDAAKVEDMLISVMRKQKPDVEFSADGVKKELWKISDVEIINKLQNIMQNEKIFIADGHHRFNACVALRDHLSRRQKNTTCKMPYDYAMVYFLSMKDKGLAILPTHRAIKFLPANYSKDSMLKKLSRHFYVSMVNSKEDLIKKLETADRQKRHAFGFFYDDSFVFALLKDENIIKNIGSADNSISWKKLDVSILHHFILPQLLNIKEKVRGMRNIYYYRGKTEAIRVVKSDEFKMAIFLNPTRIKEVEKVATSGNNMPHKSTYFFPKPFTGVVFHKF
ncbi:MAG: DUF1015 domain-containing protein [Candidatus Omnitrophota bacterium]